MIPTLSSSRSARRRSLNPSQITSYLVGTVGTAALFGAPQAEAAVVAVTFGDGSPLTIQNTQGISIAINAGTYGFVSGGDTGELALGRPQFYGQGSVYQTGVDSFTPGFARFFADGTNIGGTGNGNNGSSRGRAFFYGGSSLPALNMTSQTGNIAFRTNSLNWGWANVSWDATTKALTINGAFVESVASTPITINESLLAAAPEPSPALLALAGLGGVALRRRRKQAG